MLVADLPDVLANRFGAPESAVPDRHRRNAAVALVLRPPAEPPAVQVPQSARLISVAPPSVASSEVLLIRRAESKRDPWSGQMALPGGRLDPSDRTLVAAAVRETWEETGLTLVPDRDLLGRFPTVRPVSVHIPTVTIWPFVFRAAPDAEARAASAEVASAHWFSVESLTAPDNQSTLHYQAAGEDASFPCIRVDGRVVWGLTYRILARLFEL